MKKFNIKNFISNKETPLCFDDGSSLKLVYYDSGIANKYSIVITYYTDDNKKWLDLMNTDGLCKISCAQIYFKPVKKKGWMNIYKYGGAICPGYIYPTREDALKETQIDKQSPIDTIKVEWEE